MRRLTASQLTAACAARARQVAENPRAWLVALAFLLRLGWVLAVPSRPVGDFALYREAAEYLSDQGQLDGEFVYMPGYVMLLALLRACGGDLLAAKMVGVVAGTAVVFAAGGIAHALFGRRAGLMATLLAALWPAGIAVASVTGTDMPAAALGALAVYVLVRWGGTAQPWGAVLGSGILFGLAAWVRAVAAPLAGLSLLYWLACRVPWPRALLRTAAAIAVAFLVLLPWGVRNRRLYGEFFFTDSHGGNTALVGANPNSEGTYSRSLNLMFTKGTGYRLFEPPQRHRQSDRAAYDLAKSWTAFEPLYAAGLVVAKADRLLSHERNLLYWPIYRQGVLDASSRAWFDAHRRALEWLTDIFWWLVAALAAAGVAICARQRSWPALSLLAFPAALIGIYTLFFAEVRYHLAIVPLLFPYAACAVDAVISALAIPATPRTRDQRRRTALVALGAAVGLFVCWAALLAVGAGVRARHRWAVSVCAYPSAAQTRLCLWRRGPFPGGGTASPLRGTWDDVGMRIPPGSPAEGVVASARTELPIPAGRFRVTAAVSVAAAEGRGPSVAVALRANGRIVARTVSPRWQSADPNTAPGARGGSLSPPLARGVKETRSAPPLIGVVELTGSPLVLELEVEPEGIGSTVEDTVWVSQLVVERF